MTRHVLTQAIRLALLFTICGSISARLTERALADDQGLIGHWKLAADCQDSSGHERHGVNHGVLWDSTKGALFGGVDSYIEVPNSSGLELGKKDFSVSVWVHTEAKLTDVLGDIFSKYDPQRRNGITLGVMNYAGITTSQPNYRNLSFGIDADHADAEWTDCGRAGEAVFVMALAVCDGRLYAGVYQEGKDVVGHVYRYEGGSTWSDCGFPGKSNAVATLAVYDGKLYAGSARYKPRNSLLQEPSQNTRLGGAIYRYDGDSNWTNCGKVGDADGAAGLAVFDGKLYSSTLYKESKGLYRYDGGEKWTDCGNPARRPQPLTVFNGSLYAGSPDQGNFLRYDGGEKWTDFGPTPGEIQIYSFAAYEGRLYQGSWPQALVYVFDFSTNRWSPVGQLGREQEVMGLAVYNGKLFGGTLPLGKIFRYDGPDRWTFINRIENTPNVAYRRVWSMAVFQGKLFAGTLPSGHVYCYEAGKCVTDDHELAPGWRHIAAIKAGGELRLYVDGQRVASSSSFNPIDYDLTNSAPLRIGFGQHDYFNGRMKDVRLYDRGLSDDEIRVLARKEMGS